MNLFLPDLDFICATFAKDRKRFSGNVFSTGRTKYKKTIVCNWFFFRKNEKENVIFRKRLAVFSTGRKSLQPLWCLALIHGRASNFWKVNRNKITLLSRNYPACLKFDCKANLSASPWITTILKFVQVAKLLKMEIHFMKLCFRACLQEGKRKSKFWSINYYDFKICLKP